MEKDENTNHPVVFIGSWYICFAKGTEELSKIDRFFLKEFSVAKTSAINYKNNNTLILV